MIDLPAPVAAVVITASLLAICWAVTYKNRCRSCGSTTIDDDGNFVHEKICAYAPRTPTTDYTTTKGKEPNERTDHGNSEQEEG